MNVNDTPIAIFDIDGTLSNPEHRRKHLEGEITDKDWDKFFSEVGKDPVKPWAARMARMYYHNNYEVIIVTGRRGDNDTRRKTENWLKRHDIFHHKLYMRDEGDRRPDYKVKKEILEGKIDKDRVEIVVDDRSSVVEMWRSQGLTVLQCAEGDF